MYKVGKHDSVQNGTNIVVACAKRSSEIFSRIFLHCFIILWFSNRLSPGKQYYFSFYSAKMLFYPCFSGLVFDLGGENQICWNNTYCSEMDPRICFLLFEQFTSKKFSESNVWRFIISFDHHKVSGLQFVWGKTRKSNRLNWIRNPQGLFGHSTATSATR